MVVYVSLLYLHACFVLCLFSVYWFRIIFAKRDIRPVISLLAGIYPTHILQARDTIKGDLLQHIHLWKMNWTKTSCVATGLLSLKACKQRHYCIRDTKTCRGATCMWPVLFDGKDHPEVSKQVCTTCQKKTHLLLKSQCCHPCSQRGVMQGGTKMILKWSCRLLCHQFLALLVVLYWPVGVQNCHLSQWQWLLIHSLCWLLYHWCLQPEDP